MRGFKIYLLIFLLSVLTLTGASCIRIKSDQTAAGDGGVYKSMDKGEKWIQKSSIATVEAKAGIGGVNILNMTFDPQDNNAIYLGSEGYGIFYTYDGGESWHQSKGLNIGIVKSIAIDSKDKCTIYASIGNTIYKTEDCSRTWKKAYVDTNADQVITSLVVDFYNTSIIYAGSSRGELFRSIDNGVSWTVLRRFESEIAKVVMDNKDSRLIYVATKNRGVFKTLDGGKTWIDLNENLVEFKDSIIFYDLALDYSKKDHIILASRHGLLESNDGGLNWTSINLLTPVDTMIYSLTINPQDGKEIYYTTKNNLYKSVDGGNSWKVQQFPSSRTAMDVLIDPLNSNIIYMGFKLFEQKKGVLGF